VLVRVLNIKQLLRPTDIQVHLFDMPWLAELSAYLVPGSKGWPLTCCGLCIASVTMLCFSICCPVVSQPLLNA
jgi:hypothetical protein